MVKRETIKIWNRRAQHEEDEVVYGEGALRFLYGSLPGRFLAGLLLKRRSFNWFLGFYWSTGLSLDRIEPFIEELGIDMSEFEERDYSSFNEFFTRRFRPGARTFCDEPWDFPAFAEGRYLAFERIDATTTYPVKGTYLRPREILGDGQQAEAFIGGPLLICRLCPADYHRFHYPDSGRHCGMIDIRGALHSVNPIALRVKNDIFSTNHRRVSYLTTTNFGRLAFVEVGAMGVGKIAQTHPETDNFARGDEKGLFAFGGSTILLFGQPGYWRPDSDLLEQTAMERETFVELGSRIAASSRRSAELGKLVGLEGNRAYRVLRG